MVGFDDLDCTVQAHHFLVSLLVTFAIFAFMLPGALCPGLSKTWEYNATAAPTSNKWPLRQLNVVS